MEANDDILYITFNQDSTSLSVGTKRGYQIYALNQLDELNKLHEYEINDVYIVERLFSSSLVTLVSLVAPRKLQVCHFQKGLELCNQSYSNTILAIRLNRTRLVVCLEESLYIHNIRDMKVLHTIRDTPPNSQGICELCPSEISYLAYPGSLQSGEVQVFDASNLQAVTMITAHSSRIAALKFSPDGTKLATASEKGTVIKVFSVPNGEKMFEFRRGMKRCATIYSLAFSADALFLCCSSSTETVHVFKLEHHDEKEARPIAEEQTAGVQSWMNYVSKTAASYLPGPVSDMFQQDRAFAQAKLPHGGCKSVCALILLRQKLLLLVASVEGFLYAFDFNKDEGGECQLVKQHRLITNSRMQQQDATQSDGSAKSLPPPASGRQNSQRSYAATVQKENDAGSNPDPSANAADYQTQAKNFDSSRQHGSLNLDDVQEFPPMTHTSG